MTVASEAFGVFCDYVIKSNDALRTENERMKASTKMIHFLYIEGAQGRTRISLKGASESPVDDDGMVALSADGEGIPFLELSPMVLKIAGLPLTASRDDESSARSTSRILNGSATMNLGYGSLKFTAEVGVVANSNGYPLPLLFLTDIRVANDCIIVKRKLSSELQAEIELLKTLQMVNPMDKQLQQGIDDRISSVILGNLCDILKTATLSTDEHTVHFDLTQGKNVGNLPWDPRDSEEDDREYWCV